MPFQIDGTTPTGIDGAIPTGYDSTTVSSGGGGSDPVMGTLLVGNSSDMSSTGYVESNMTVGVHILKTAVLNGTAHTGKCFTGAWDGTEGVLVIRNSSGTEVGRSAVTVLSLDNISVFTLLTPVVIVAGAQYYLALYADATLVLGATGVGVYPQIDAGGPVYPDSIPTVFVSDSDGSHGDLQIWLEQ